MNNRRSPILSLIYLGCLVLTSRVLGVDAESVFKAVGSGVVLIKDLEGFGSGVVLTSDGLIVSCYHVVNTPLKQTVVAEVQNMGRRTKQEFTDVKVVGVHPRYDLALIQVKVPAGTMFVVPPKALGRTVNTGEECFVLGNPSGASGKVLENSISKGIIGAADRVVDDLHFIQVTAQINPGNSGGALCDKNGQVVGIVTFKVDQAEGLGFAIPISAVRRSDFVAAKERKGNRDLGIKYEEAGARWFNIARCSEGTRRETALFLAYVCYRLSLSELPESPSPYNNVGLMYYEMKEYEMSKAFCEKAVELEPDYPTSHHMLGTIAFEQKDGVKAKKHFLAGIQTKKTDDVDVQAQTACVENYGVEMIHEKRYAEAAYLARWSQSLRKDDRRQANLQNMFQEAAQHLSDVQFAEISGKRSDFSLDDMKRFASGKSAPATGIVSGSTTPTATSPLTSTSGSVATGLLTGTSFAKIFEKMVEGAPKPEAAGLKKALPEVPADVRPAFGGAYLVMHFKGMGKLGVFNLPQVKFDAYIPASEDVVYAAGGVNLVLYLPKERVFQVWDMRTLQRISSKLSRIVGELTDIDMGLFGSQSALISYADSTDQLARRRYAIMDLQSFQTVEISDNTFNYNNSYRDNVQMRPDENFSAVTMWCTSHSPSGLVIARFGKRGVSDVVYQHKDFGSLALDWQGQKIYSTHGSVLNLRGDVLKTYTGAALFAVHGGSFFLEVRKKQVIVREALAGSEIGRFELPFEFDVTAWSKTNLTDDRLVHASAQLNRACFVDQKTSFAYVFELGLGADAQQARQALEVVRKGTLWTRKMNFPAGTRVNVEDAPAGTRYDPATSTLSWTIPQTQPSGSVTIFLSVTMPGKDEVYQRVVVPVQ